MLTTHHQTALCAQVGGCALGPSHGARGIRRKRPGLGGRSTCWGLLQAEHLLSHSMAHNEVLGCSVIIIIIIINSYLRLKI